MQSLAVIGAGISGLTVASQLKQYFDIKVFDKSRGVSGRMSTRAALPYRFDHGAQYFKVREPQFAHFIHTAIEQGLVAEWHPRVVELAPDGIKPMANEQPWYVATPTMTALNKALASDCDVQLNQRVQSLEFVADQWQLLNDAGQSLGSYDFVISAIPQPQLALLCPEMVAADNALASVTMSGCFSLMLGCSTEQLLDFDFARVSNSPIGIISHNSSKPGREDAPSVVVQSTNHWAEQMIDQPLEDVEQYLIEELSRQTGIDYQTLDYSTLHRWRYAFVNQALGASFYRHDTLPFAACGDWCLGARIESAYMSGFNLARALIPESVS